MYSVHNAWQGKRLEKIMEKIMEKSSKSTVSAGIVAAALVFSCAIAAALACTPPAHALGKGDAFTVNGNRYVVKDYELDDDDPPEAVLVRYGSANKTPTVNTVRYRGIVFEVEDIARNAFNNAAGHKITKLTLGRNVDEIGARAFYGCKKLKYIDMSACECIDLDFEHGRYIIDDLDIGKNAFKKCGVKRVKVSCGRSNSSFKKAYKRALLACGMRSSVRVVY